MFLANVSSIEALALAILISSLEILDQKLLNEENFENIQAEPWSQIDRIWSNTRYQLVVYLCLYTFQY